MMSNSSLSQPSWQTMYTAKPLSNLNPPSNPVPAQPSSLSRFEQLLKAKLAAEQHRGFVPAIQPPPATYLDQASSRLCGTNTVFNRAFASQHYANPPPFNSKPPSSSSDYQNGYQSNPPPPNAQVNFEPMGFTGNSHFGQPAYAVQPLPNDPFQSAPECPHNNAMNNSPMYNGMQSSAGMNGQSANYQLGNYQANSHVNSGFFGVPQPVSNPSLYSSTPSVKFDAPASYDTSPVCVKIEPDLIELDRAPPPAWVNGAMRPPITQQTWNNYPTTAPPAQTQPQFDAFQSAYPYMWSTPVTPRNELCPPSLESSHSMAHSTSSSTIPLPVTPNISPPTPTPHFQPSTTSHMPLPYHHINRYTPDATMHSPASSIRSIKSESSLVSLGPAMFMDMNGQIRMPTLKGASAGAGGEDGMNGLGSYEGNAGYDGGGIGGDGNGNGDGGMNGGGDGGGMGGGGGSGSGSGGGSRDGDGGDGGRGNNTPKSKKLVLACHFCRRRKLKCDGVHPNCNNCSRRNELCTYDESVRRRGPGRRTKEMRDRAQREAESAGMVNENSLGMAVAAIGDLGQGDSVMGLQDGIGMGMLGGENGNGLGGAGPSTLAEIGGKGKDGGRKREGEENGDGAGKRSRIDHAGEGELSGLVMDSSTIPLDPELDPALEALSRQPLTQHTTLGDEVVDLSSVVNDQGEGDTVEVDYQTLEDLERMQGSIGMSNELGDENVEVDLQALERLERHFAAQGQAGGLGAGLELGDEDGVQGYRI